jgi:PII-like signaling protein
MSATEPKETRMSRLTRACRLSIYLGNADTHRHKALSGEILHRAHHAGLAGATTLLGIEGFGHSSTIHATPRWRLTDRSPVTVHIIDTPEKVQHFLPQLDDLADECLIVCDEVLVLGTTSDADTSAEDGR